MWHRLLSVIPGDATASNYGAHSAPENLEIPRKANSGSLRLSNCAFHFNEPAISRP
ncbi:hypothetical protein BRAS3843_770004 [Bradyrhizobium sp. STM 3843]|nr:hypothetical protein BRAS3843_770004 [Bradyrhizobium sp. STM 3843]